MDISGVAGEWLWIYLEWKVAGYGYICSGEWQMMDIYELGGGR